MSAFDPLDESHFRIVPPRRLPLSALAQGRVAPTGAPGVAPPGAPGVAPTGAPGHAAAGATPVPGSGRVLFADDFAPIPARRRAAAPPPEPEPLPPSFSEAELEEARRAAFRDGRDAGRTGARAEAEAAGQAALDAIAREFSAHAAVAERAAAQAAETGVRLVVGLLGALHPSLAPALAAADIEAMAAAVLPHLAAEPHLTLRLCPPLAETLAPRIRALAAGQGFRGEITFRPDAAIAPDGAALSWSAGAALRDPAALRAALLECLIPLGLGPLSPENDHVERAA
jgi:flagellar assembly protein FliH